jgi:YidC/Oxa1 family membrane protein insertase
MRDAQFYGTVGWTCYRSGTRMDFGVGFLSKNVMLPILDFFYGLVPSYGLAIVALTLVIRFALYPLSAGSIRNARRMKIANPVLQKRQQEVRERYKDDPTKQQEELSKLFKEFGNPLAGCLPLLVQMPVLFALFATLRGSPFSDINYSLNLQILPSEKMEQVEVKAFASKPQNIYVTDGIHTQVAAILPGGSQIGVGESAQIKFQTLSGQPLRELMQDYPDTKLSPRWTITKGDDRASIDEFGVITALEPGDITVQATLKGLAASRGFLFIQALGEVGVRDAETGAIHWDILIMVLGFGGSLFVNQLLSGQGASANPQQDTVNKVTPLIFSGMFLFFPLPAGVLMYMLIANIFQTAQTFILMQEPLPENLQKIVDDQERQLALETGANRLPFEPASHKKASKEKEKDSKTTNAKSTPQSPRPKLSKSKSTPKPTPKSSSRGNNKSSDGFTKKK